jgi:hypothetical protein
MTNNNKSFALNFRSDSIKSLKDLAYIDARLAESALELTRKACEMVPEIGQTVNPLDLTVKEIIKVPDEIVTQLKDGYLLRYLETRGIKHVIPMSNGKEKIIETKIIMRYTSSQMTAMVKHEDELYMTKLKAIRKAVQTDISKSYKRLEERCAKYRLEQKIADIAELEQKSIADVKKEKNVGGRGATLTMSERIPKMLDDLYTKGKQAQSNGIDDIDLILLNKLILKFKSDALKCIKPRA